MTVFEQLELLPLAYLVVLAWVVGANLLAKLLAPRLIESTSGPVRSVLAKDLHIQVTGDGLYTHLFEQSILERLNAYVVFHLIGDLARLAGGTLLQPVLIINHRTPKALYPEKYWSGCPPPDAG